MIFAIFYLIFNHAAAKIRSQAALVLSVHHTTDNQFGVNPDPVFGKPDLNRLD
jgi:hypothetical protein